MNTDIPLVSVFIPTYNQQEYIAASIQSALDQDYENLEIVVGDDCSKDNTWQIVQEFQRRYPGKVKGFRNQKNLGITGNCNEVLKRCTGEFICFSAGDDLFLPGKIKAQVKWFLDDGNRVLCGHQVEVFYEDNSKSHKLTPIMTQGQGVRRIIEDGCPYGGVSVMVRRNRMPRSGYDERNHYCAEYKIWIDCIGENGVYGYIPGIYAKYRKHNNNITSQTDLVLSDIERLLLNLQEDFPEMHHSIRRGLTNQIYIPRARELFKSGRYFKGGIKLAWFYFISPRRFFRALAFRFFKYSRIGV